MNWILGILALGCFGWACALWWQQVKADAAFWDWLNRQ